MLGKLYLSLNVLSTVLLLFSFVCADFSQFVQKDTIPTTPSSTGQSVVVAVSSTFSVSSSISRISTWASWPRKVNKQCTCGMQSNEKLRSPFPQPWVVGITRNDRSSIVCSGVLINELYVLTTANCARMTTGSSRVIIPASEMPLIRNSTSFTSETNILQQLRAQSSNNTYSNATETNQFDEEDDSSPFFESLPISDVRINPKFVSSLFNVASYSLRNDVALIRLQQKLPLASRQSRAVAICLPDQPFARLHEPHERVHIAGYAAAFSNKGKRSSKSDSNEFDRFLWQREAAMLSSNECKQVWQQFYQKGRQLCTQSRQNGLCEGGLGSGLTVRRYGRQYLLGLLSLGSRQCARSSMPDLFVDLALYLPWIYRNTVDSAYCIDRID